VTETLRFTLLGDGPSDKVLLGPLRWLLESRVATRPISLIWADLGRMHKPPGSLAERIEAAFAQYPCDLLFVHRDAEREPAEHRYAEIRKASSSPGLPPIVCVVPVRVTEAWLLFDERALRLAAENPNGKVPLALPTIGGLEDSPDPKSILHGLLREASGYHGRRLKKFRAEISAGQIVDHVGDFTPLRQLPSFAQLEADIDAIVQAQDWHLPLSADALTLPAVGRTA